jgi:hypothetical protein
LPTIKVSIEQAPGKHLKAIIYDIIYDAATLQYQQPCGTLRHVLQPSCKELLLHQTMLSVPYVLEAAVLLPPPKVHFFHEVDSARSRKDSDSRRLMGCKS